MSAHLTKFQKVDMIRLVFHEKVQNQECLSSLCHSLGCGNQLYSCCYYCQDSHNLVTVLACTWLQYTEILCLAVEAWGHKLHYYLQRQHTSVLGTEVFISCLQVMCSPVKQIPRSWKQIVSDILKKLIYKLKGIENLLLYWEQSVKEKCIF